MTRDPAELTAATELDVVTHSTEVRIWYAAQPGGAVPFLGETPVTARPRCHQRSLAWQAMRAVFPGSFDPATQGHLDVARRAAGMFDEVVMCVLTNPKKTGRLPLIDRLALLADMTSDLANVTVDSSIGRLLVDYCRRAGIDVIVRGVRTQGDLEHELPMAHMNRHLSGIETLFVPTSPAQAYISSTLIAATTQR
jgi:pantetheine-phosphate adenylyltransferase